MTMTLAEVNEFLARRGKFTSHSEIPRPVSKVKNIPPGCKTEIINIEIPRANRIYTIQGEIVYGTPKARMKAIVKWNYSAVHWFLQTHISQVEQNPAVKYKDNLHFQHAKSPFHENP